MKIFYAVQATGNGHISRAMSLLPHLQQYGEVDIFLSGSNAQLNLDAPVRYRSKGISLFYTCDGRLDYWQITRKISPLSIRKEIRELPVEKYDLVLNDFDYITSAACARKGIPSIHFGHQASFLSPDCPRPEKKSRAGEWILTHFVKATAAAGFHFDKYDTHIFRPVVKKAILEAEPADKGHITVYLPSFCEPELRLLFEQFPEHRFEIFSRDTKAEHRSKHIFFRPVSNDAFTRSLIDCSAIICGAGFETPAEALHLGKRMLAIPINGQYEQQCNAAALKLAGVTCLDKIDADFPAIFRSWIADHAPATRIDCTGSIQESLDFVFSLAPAASALTTEPVY